MSKGKAKRKGLPISKAAHYASMLDRLGEQSSVELGGQNGLRGKLTTTNSLVKVSQPDQPAALRGTLSLGDERVSKSAFLLWCGYNGWTNEEAKAVLTANGVQYTEGNVRAQCGNGRVQAAGGERQYGPIPALSVAFRNAAEAARRAISATTNTEVERLEHTAEKHERPSTPLSGGAGFGDPKTNPVVERAAVDFVTKEYQRSGWSVTSVERDRCGFDLDCRRAAVREHVEVKGVSGSEVSFIITRNEVRLASSDPQFVLCVVTTALTAPKLTRYSGSEFKSRFSLEPIQYWAKPKPKE